MAMAASSSSESEYVALADFENENGFFAVPIMENNKAIKMANLKLSNSRTRHIKMANLKLSNSRTRHTDVKHHVFRDAELSLEEN